MTGARVILAAAAAVSALAAFAPAAGAYVAVGPTWPWSVVTYGSEAPAYSDSIDRAARLVNRANIGVRLRRDNGDPDVTFLYSGSPCDGAAYVGFRRRRANTVLLGRGCSRDLITLTAVHELGHVLGLDHEPRACARMNPSFDRTGTPARCARRPLAWWLAHPFTSDDLRGLRGLY